MVARVTGTCCAILMYDKAFLSVCFCWFTTSLSSWDNFGLKVTALRRNTFAEALLSEALRSSNSSIISSKGKVIPLQARCGPEGG